MRFLLVTLLLAPVMVIPRAAGAQADLSGDWEIQSMGGDRDVRIQQKAGKLMVHREMWPEFEGEKYKLEHLYRGTLAGDTIAGQLLVREDGKGKYDVLRNFTGRVISSSKIEIDSYLVKRIGSTAAAATPSAPATPDRTAPSAAPPAPSPTPAPHTLPAASPAPSPTAAPLTPPPPPPPPPSSGLPSPGPPPPAAPRQPAPPPGQPASLFDQIMATPGMRDLFAVEAREIPPRARRLTDEGDAAFAAGEYRTALAKFEAANEVDGARGVDLLHRMGRCYLKLRQPADAQRVLGRALRLDPNNGAVRDAYGLAKGGR